MKTDNKTVNRRAILIGFMFSAVFIFSLIYCMWTFWKQDENKTAVVYQDGKVIMELSCSGAETKTWRVDGKDGAYNIIEVSPNGIQVIESSCPDHICENTVWKSKNSLPIICLPNRLLITAKQGENEEGLDAITY